MNPKHAKHELCQGYDLWLQMVEQVQSGFKFGIHHGGA